MNQLIFTNRSIFYFILCIFIIISLVKSYLFTALVDIEKLVFTEKEVPNLLKLYFKSQKNLTSEIASLYKPFMKSKFTYIKNSEKFVSNPINVFHLMKRLTLDIGPLFAKLNTTLLEEIAQNYTVNGEKINFPSEDDFSEACLSLSRLQKTYNLSISNISNGRLVKGQRTFSLLAIDCYHIGRRLLLTEKYFESIEWLNEALRKLAKEKVRSIALQFVLELLTENYYKKGIMQMALYYAGKFLETDPKDKTIIQIYNSYIISIREAGSNYVPVPDSPEPIPEDLWDKYVKLCNNHHLISASLEKKLKCYYSARESSLLKLQPIQIEDVFLKPWIVIFHNILNNKEIKHIKELAKPKLSVAGVSKDETQKTTDYRIGQSAWVADNESVVITKLSKRLQEITGLDIETAEFLQVVNYGVAGFYTTHVDYTRRIEELLELENSTIGNRIATLLIYMTDVNNSGRTIFPYLNVSVLPKKGSALFWYNLHKTGEGNYNTRHAACPVLIGNKWIANKWFHERGQEFRYTCGITKSDLYYK